jgi:hypothetical protein
MLVALKNTPFTATGNNDKEKIPQKKAVFSFSLE